MKLVIAEKSSVAQSIAKVIGATKREDGYLSGGGYLVSWCVGHLVELASPEVYDEKYEKWRYEDLPILPENWVYQVSDSTRKQFQILKKLMERDDVTHVVNACDAGREGELIFRLVYDQAGCRKPFERLWISSMEDQAISDGFSNLRGGENYDDLYAAALCRERADWIVGMNATRLFSTLYGQTLNVGRVMTPTLAMIVEREAAINGFKPEPFHKVSITCVGANATTDRMEKEQNPEEILESVKQAGEAVVTKFVSKERQEKAPQLYSLTALQRDANKVYGFTAQQTLDYTQSLYEKKLVTYPRTDSRFLTEDMEGMLPNLVTQMAEAFGYTKGLLVNVDQTINNSKVTDHHAIIPTVNVASINFAELPSGEQKILRLITARLLAAVGENSVYKETEIEFEVADTIFKTKNKSLMKKGWKEIQDWMMGENALEEKEMEEQDFDGEWGDISEGMKYPISDAKVVEGVTTAPKRYTESSLLSAMERAGSEEMPDEVERKGIGTSATRAGVIEKLVRIGFVERRGDRKTKYLVPTHKGIALITVMPEQIQSSTMTADWEQKLLNIEKGEETSDAFMAEINEMIRELVQTYHVIQDAEVLMHPAKEVIGTCPCCGKQVMEHQKGFFCEDRNCGFALWKENRYFDSIGKTLTKSVAVKLLTDGKAHLSNCKSKKTGKMFSPTLLMKVDEKNRPIFSMEFENRTKSKER